MIRAVIVEDNFSAAQVLKRRLTSSGRVSVVACATDGHEGLRLLNEMQPDVAFLDISLPQPNGIEIAQALADSESPPLIVFVTGFPEYATQAFEVDAVDFIVKPFDPRRIEKCLDRIERDLPRRSQLGPTLREVVARLASQHGGVSHRLAVKDTKDGAIHILDLHHIICIERKERRIIASTADEIFLVNSTIERLEERLRDHGFLRVNAGTLVNLACVRRLQPRGDGSYDLTLNDPHATTLPVSRSRAKSLRTALQL